MWRTTGVLLDSAKNESSLRSYNSSQGRSESSGQSDSQPDPQCCLLIHSPVLASSQTVTYFADEHGAEKSGPCLLRGNHRWSLYPPCSSSESANLKDQILQLKVAEWSRKPDNLTLAGRRPDDLGLIVVSSSREQDIKIQVNDLA